MRPLRPHRRIAIDDVGQALLDEVEVERTGVGSRGARDRCGIEHATLPYLILCGRGSGRGLAKRPLDPVPRRRPEGGQRAPSSPGSIAWTDARCKRWATACLVASIPTAQA